MKLAIIVIAGTFVTKAIAKSYGISFTDNSWVEAAIWAFLGFGYFLHRYKIAYRKK